MTVRALAEGEQLLTLRRNAPRRLEHDRFFLFPTFEHQRHDLVCESHQPELRRALEEGVWADGDPPANAMTRPGLLEPPDRVRIRAWAEVAGRWQIKDRRTLDGLSPFSVLTVDYARELLGWRRGESLDVLLLRTYRIPRPVTVRVRGEQDLRSPFLEISRELPFEGTPVLADEEFGRAAEEIESVCSGRIAALV